MRSAAYAWIAWRERTGQINKVTASGQRYMIGYFCDAMGRRQITQLGEADMERWLEEMRERLGPATVRQRWGVARSFLEYLVDEGELRRNPMRRIPTPKKPRSVHRNLRPDQTAALHAACIDNRERLVVALGFQQGMRRSEIARAELGDIDFVARSIRIVGKGGHERVGAITEATVAAVNTYIREMRIHAGPLVRDVRGRKGLSPKYIGDIFERIAYRAGVKVRPWDGVGTHSARHTAGTDVARRTGNAIIVRDFLGHVSLDTTNTYVGEMDLEEQRAAIEGRSYVA